jgi:hypothetical protein
MLYIILSCIFQSDFILYFSIPVETVQFSDTEAPISSDDISSVASEQSEEGGVSTDPNGTESDDAMDL